VDTKGIEPSSAAFQTAALPLSYVRGSAGIEPPLRPTILNCLASLVGLGIIATVVLGADVAGGSGDEDHRSPHRSWRTDRRLPEGSLNQAM
jgi:hypothetical protein